MKITCFYYLQYPDCSPADPLNAASEVYVEIAEAEGNLQKYDYKYSVTVCTVGFLKHHLATHLSYAGRSLIIVERFDDQLIKKALEEILPRIHEIGIEKY